MNAMPPDGHRSLRSCGIEPDGIDAIQVSGSLFHHEYQIFIKTMTGGTYTVDVNSSVTTERLKEQLCISAGIRPDHQLMFDGNRLEDGRALSDCEFSTLTWPVILPPAFDNAT